MHNLRHRVMSLLVVTVLGCWLATSTTPVVVSAEMSTSAQNPLALTCFIKVNDWTWKEFGKAVGEGAVGGATGGAVAGAFAGGVGAGPGAGVGALAGAAAGATVYAAGWAWGKVFGTS